MLVKLMSTLVHRLTLLRHYTGAVSITFNPATTPKLTKVRRCSLTSG